MPLIKVAADQAFISTGFGDEVIAAGCLAGKAKGRGMIMLGFGIFARKLQVLFWGLLAC